MKCYNHSEVDAVAICKTCGKGVCNDCLVTIASDSYCKPCVEAGRVKAPTPPPVKVSAPPVTVPTPTGIPSKTPFIIGGVGAIINAFGAPIAMFFAVIALISAFIGVGSYSGVVGIASVITTILMAVGLILAGIGYLGIKRNYGSGAGTASFAFSIIVTVFLFVSVAFGLIALSIGPYYYYNTNPWYAIYALSMIITLILFGVMQILWGVAHLTTRQYTGNSGLAMATGIMLIISGSLTIPVITIIMVFPLILFLISEILATVTFFISRIPQQSTQTQ